MQIPDLSGRRQLGKEKIPANAGLNEESKVLGRLHQFDCCPVEENKRINGLSPNWDVVAPIEVQSEVPFHGPVSGCVAILRAWGSYIYVVREPQFNPF